MTDAERKLWKHIRKKQIKGIQFYRQRPIGKYIVDFYAPDAKLVIEVDGGQHYTPRGKESDQSRDAFISSFGLRILRYGNHEVMSNIQGVVEDIVHHL